MKKAILAQRIYLDADIELQRKLLKELTYFIPKYRDDIPPEIICNARIINENSMSIPSGREDLIPPDYNVYDRRVVNPVHWPEFKFTLRPDQQEIYDKVESSCLINASPAWGKAQPLNSKVKVREGWVRIGDISIGDKVVTPDNKEAIVRNKFNHTNKDVYKIHTKDGRVVEACGEHLWAVYIDISKETVVINTQEIIQKLKKNKVYLPLCSPIEGSNNTLPIHPYVMGVMLGNGGFTTDSITLSSNDEFIINKINNLLPKENILKYKSNYDYQVTTKSEYYRNNTLLFSFRDLNLLGLKSHEKFIPDIYMKSSIENKIELIQGLMDSDGYVETSGTSLDFTTTSYELAKQFQELIFSLGGYANIQEKNTSYTYKGKKLPGKVSYKIRPSRLPFNIKSRLCSLPRKANRIKPSQYDEVNKLEIVNITYKGKEDCACIELDNEEKLYLTDSYVVTHNTFTGIALAQKFGQKTLVVVHTKFLFEQWMDEVRYTLDTEPGQISASKINLDAPIVITNIQKLTRLAKSEYNKDFGTVILDESHHSPASVFAAALDSMHASYKIGLTASKTRKDGKHVLFKDYFSPNVYTASSENSMTPIVHRVSLPFAIADGEDHWANKVNALSEDAEYQKVLSIVAKTYASMGRKVLVVAARTGLLEAAHRLTENSVCVIGKVKDRKTEIQKVLDDEADIIYGSMNIFSEGISINPLSVVILGTPINNNPLLEQIIGRITRKMPGKPQPIVVDLRFQGYTASNQGAMRDGYYLDKGYYIYDK